MPIDYTKRPAPEPTPEPAPAPSSSGSSSRVTLTKGSPAISLTKRGAATGVLRVNLNWDARPPQAAATGGFFKRLTGAGTAAASATVDLDLGCLYEFTDGSKGVVQALGGAFTSPPTRAGRPVIVLDGDDRSGSTSGGENLSVDLSQVATIRRLLVFAYIYEGAANWAAANGVVTLVPAVGEPVLVPLDEHDPASRMCAIAMLENTGGDLSVRREVRYVNGSQRALDEAYGWGMSWAQGRK